MDLGPTRTSTDDAGPISGPGAPEFRNAIEDLFGNFGVEIRATGPGKKALRKKSPPHKKPANAEEVRADVDDPSPGAPPGLVDNIRTCCECPVCRGPLLRAMLSPCGHAICSSCLGMVTAAAQTPRPTTDMNITPYENDGDPPVPTCPTCRAPVHRDLYVRCFALDAIIGAAHPDMTKFSAPEGNDSEIDEEPSFRNLRAWKAAQDEQLVQQAVKAIWAAVKAALPTSTALLLSEAKADDDDFCHAPVRAVRHIIRGGPFGGPGERSPQADAYPGVSPRVMDTILMGSCAEEVARRMKDKGLSLEVFTSRGKRFALVRWPNIPPAFTPVDPVAIVEVPGGNRGARFPVPPEPEPFVDFFDPPSEESANNKVGPPPRPSLVAAKPDAGPAFIAPPPRIVAKKSVAAPARTRK